MSRRQFTWGGARTGAGRPARGRRASERHLKRPAIARERPLHVIARAVRGVSLRSAAGRAAIDRALALARARHDFRIVRIVTRASQIDLVVEATDRVALARGMQGFQVSVARRLNGALHRSGAVFADRYVPRY